MPPVSPSLALAALAAIAGLSIAVIRLVVTLRQLAAELAAVRRRFSDCMDLAPFAAYMKDADGRYIYANRALVKYARTARPDIRSFLGQTDDELFPGPDGQDYVAHDRDVLAHGTPLAFDNTSVDADGTVRHWSTLKFPWTDDQGRTCVAGVSIDRSESGKAQRDARTSEERCALALEAGRMGTLTMDLETRILETSSQFAVLHGRPETSTRLTLEESLADVHPDDRQSIVEIVEAALRDRAPGRITYRVIRPDGSIKWIELVGQVYADETGRPATVRGVAFDVTQRQAAYEELARRKAMLRRLIEVQENERQTLCHELHDGMMQYAIGAKMLLETARDEVDPASRTQQLDAAVDCLVRGIAEGRQLIRGVRSAVLDDLGLKAAIEDLADQMALHGVAVEAALDDALDTLPSDLLTTVYRVVQESLANVRKHAGTDFAWVSIRRTPIEVHVCITDRGQGFDVAEARKRGFGLVGMIDRVRLAQGTCTIESRPGSGTRIDLRLPIPTAAEEPPPVIDAAPAYAAAPALPPR